MTGGAENDVDDDFSGLVDIEKMLMDEYGLEAEPEAVSEVPSSSAQASVNGSKHAVHQDITSLDAINFSAAAWLESRKNVSLETLFQQQRTLRADIALLKNDTQTLVHDNYNRFITAADIIRTMRGEFSGMVQDTEQLQQDTDLATTASADMNTRLKVLDDDLQSLSALLQLLTQLRAVKELPARLEVLIKTKDYGSAVNLYKSAQSLFTTHGHYGLLRDTKAATERIMNVAKSEVLAVLSSSETEAAAVQAAVSMLRMLDTPVSERQHAFLSGRRAAIDAVLADAAQEVAAAEADLSLGTTPALAAGSGTDAGLAAFVSKLSWSLLPVLSETIKVYGTVFGVSARGGSAAPALDPDIAALVESSLQSYVATVQAAVAAQGRSALALSAPFYRKAVLDLQQDVRPAQDGAGGPGSIRGVLFEGDFGFGGLLAALHAAAAALAAQRDQLGSLGVDDIIADLVSGSLRHRLGGAIVTVEQTLANIANSIVPGVHWDAPAPQTNQAMLRGWVDALGHAAESGCDAVVVAFRPLFALADGGESGDDDDDAGVADAIENETEANGSAVFRSYVGTFSGLLQSELQRLLVGVISTCQRACEPMAADAEVVTRSELGFSAVHLGRNPLYPSSPRQSGTARGTGSTGPGAGAAAALDDIALDRSPSPAPSAAAAAATPPFEARVPAPAGKAAPPLLHAVTAVIFERLRSSSVAKVVEAMARHGVMHQGYDSGPPPFVAKAIQTRLEAAARQALQAYVLRAAAAPQLAPAVCAAMADPAFVDAPGVYASEGRPFCGELVAAMQHFAAESSAILPPGAALPDALSRSPKRHAHSRSVSREAGFAAPDPLDNPDGGQALFRKRGSLAVADVKLNVHAVVSALATHLLQCAVEVARTQVMSKGAVAQCRVDMRALQAAVSLPAAREFYQDVVAACEGCCTAV